MQQTSEQPVAERPIGTLALLGAAAAFMLAAWLFLYFGVFLPRGALS